MRRAGTVAALLVLLMTAFWFKAGLIALPEVPKSASPGAFDTGRAVARLARILGDERPHPVDSVANDAVRERLIAELRAMGLAPAVTDDIACNGTAKSRTVSCARVRNVLARIGPAAGPAVMMVSHYDSTPVGPGAADDGIGIAVMLEAAALLRERPLRRPVLLLFNEGEEAGLIGARAFVDKNPLARQVEAVINLEARGVAGPALMFETSRPNAAAIAAFARASDRPLANSASADFYRLIPNDTDVSVFRERPWTILNFAIIGNETRYHSPGDRLAALDRRSVRHMGEQALAATARLAAEGVPRRAGDRLYMDILGRTLVVLPMALGLTLLAVALALFAWLASRRRGGVLLAAATVAVGIADAAILGFLGQQALGLLRGGGDYWRAHPQALSLGLYLSAFAACTAALLVLARRIARDRLRIGYWLLFLLLGAGLSLAVPGAAVYFLAPPLVAGTAMLARRWERPAALAAWAMLFLTWGPLLHLSQVLLDLDNGWIFAAMAALILWPVLIEMKPLLVRLPTGGAVAAIAATAVLGWAPALTRPAYSEDRKQAFGIEYAWDQVEAKGRWLVANDGAPLPAAFRGFERGAEVPWSGRRRWAAAAPALAVAPPRIDKLAERWTPGGRLLTLGLATNGAETVLVRAKPEAGFLAVRAGGRTMRFGGGRRKDDFVLRCLGRSCEGMRIELLLASSSPVEAALIGIRTGLPAAAEPLVRARPALAQPQYSPDSTVAVGKVRL